MGRGDFTCPVCGHDVYANAKACPSCGADERSGWREDADVIDAESALGISEPDDFDYDAFVESEFGGGESRRSSKELFWCIVAAALLGVFVFAFALR